MTLSRSRVARSLDVQRISEAVSRPGIDPRLWVSLAVVEAVKVDPDHGVLVDVMLLPTEIHETARVLSMYAGNGFGLYLPIEVEDEILVVSPGGDPGQGLVAIPGLWSAADPPPGDAGSHPTDLLLLAKDGATIRVATGGAGNIIVEPRGTGEVRLGAESASEKAVRGTTYRGAESSLMSALQASMVSLATALNALGTEVALTLPTRTACIAAGAGATATAAAVSSFEGGAATYLAPSVRVP